MTNPPPLRLRRYTQRSDITQSKFLPASTGPRLEARKDVAESAGLSPRQAKNAIRVANVQKEAFERQVDSES